MSPFKPTGDDAVQSSRPQEMADQALKPADDEIRRMGRGREERGSAEGSRRHPPHVTENDEGAPLQEEEGRPSPIAALPANASGREEISADEAAQEIDEESMYDGRPEEDKDRPASSHPR